MTIQFNITSCSTGTDAGQDGDNGTALVNNPTNNYQVVAEVISVGGLGGCSIGAVADQEGFIENADFRINNTIHHYIESSFYADTLNQLNYLPGSNYTLNVSYMNQTIASGTAKMPSPAFITNLDDIKNHDLNSAMTVKWSNVQNATSIQLIISGDIIDPSNQEYLYREFESVLISPNSTSFTIPDTFFKYQGEYELGIIAYHGVNPDFDILNLGDTGYEKSYNMNGAAGVFLAACLSSANGETITVGTPLVKLNPQKPAKSFKDLVLEKHKKYFGGRLK